MGDALASPRTGGDRVLLVEDEESIAEPFSHALAREGFVPILAATVAEARASLAQGEPDIVLLDLMLPDGDGRELARELRGRSQVPIIMLTARGSEIDRVLGLELGADDYVVKPFAAAEVIARIRAVLRRSRQREPAARLTVGDVTVDIAARQAWLGGRELSLTRKEFDLLARLARSAGQVVTREDLMSDVWDENWFGSTKTLDVHMTALRRKLGEDPLAPRHIQTVRGVGFRFAPAQEARP
ncbi:MAG TPA: response regulator transcription factor [Solirubrobacteraceae bacterium]|nr:response regulator transcription factor [Solirubrobacteraceae bacterium]